MGHFSTKTALEREHLNVKLAYTPNAGLISQITGLISTYGDDSPGAHLIRSDIRVIDSFNIRAYKAQ
jgi:hypothetical protein